MRMAVFPLLRRKNGLGAQSKLARLPILAAAFLIALFGLLSGAPRNADITASARSVDDRSDRSPSLTKREPLRAVTATERKDGVNGHISTDDGLPPPAFAAFATHDHNAAQALEYRTVLIPASAWPGSLPRAPPSPLDKGIRLAA
jgi:hypothetical protein